jgi:hypothetical protein
MEGEETPHPCHAMKLCAKTPEITSKICVVIPGKLPYGGLPCYAYTSRERLLRCSKRPRMTAISPHQERGQDVRARRDSQEATEPRYWKPINCNRQGQVLKKGIPKTNKPIPSSLSSAQDARGARMAHGGASRSRTIWPRKNIQ